jgi:Ala-tRNA(Pro) deacylase
MDTHHHHPPPAHAATRAELLALLDRIGVAHATVDHEPVFTVDESDRVETTIPGGHTKNLFLKDRKGGLWLVCALSAAAIDLNALAKLLGVQRFSFGAADLMRDVLGVTPGSVTAFALVNDRLNRVALVLDQGLLACDLVNFHPLRNDATTSISPTGLMRFLEETGHRPLMVDFTGDGSPRLVEDEAH